MSEQREPEYPSVPPHVLMPEPPVDLDDLDDAMRMHGMPAEAVPEHVQAVKAWRPEDDAAAEWAMAQLAACEAERAALRAQAIGWQEQISAWLADAERGAVNRAAFFAQALEGYARRRHDADPKLRTVRLPSGQLKITVPQAGTVEVTDERALMMWLLTDTGSDYIPADHVIKQPEPSVLVSELRKHVKAVQVDGEWRAVAPTTGEQPPGTKAVGPKEPTYRVVPG